MNYRTNPRTLRRFVPTAAFCLVLLFGALPARAQPNFDPDAALPPPPSASSADKALPAETVPLTETPPAETPDVPYVTAQPDRPLDTLTMTLSSDGVQLDFRKAWYAGDGQVFTGLLEGLFTYHPLTMRPVMGVISAYSLSEDKKEWTFTIRENAKFSNGDPVRAEDFCSSWFSLLRTPNSPYASFFDIIVGAKDFRTGKTTDPASVGVKADKGKLIVTLNSPAAFFPSMLCHYAFGVSHPDTIAMFDSGNFDVKRFIGNGPFKLAESDDTHVTLEKNAHYWDAGNVGLNTIIIKYINDPDEATALWNSGEARWLGGDVDIDALSDRAGIQLNPMFGTHYYYIRSFEAPWNDERVRKALSIALPWDEIRKNYLLPAETLILPLQNYPEVKGRSAAAPAEAAQLLADAGYPEGKGLPELVIKIGSYSEAVRVAGIMAEAWGKLGVPVQVKEVDARTYSNSDSLKANDYHVGYMSWIGDFADPYSFLVLFETDSSLNDAEYHNPEFDALIQKSMTEEGDGRMKTVAQAEQMLIDQGVVLPMYHIPALNIVDMDELAGWYPNMLDVHPFKYLYFARIKPLPGVAMIAPKR